MEILDSRDLVINSGDIVEIGGYKFLVVFETGSCAWHFLKIDTMKFDAEIYTDVPPKIGEHINQLGIITNVIKEGNISLTIHGS